MINTSKSKLALVLSALLGTAGALAAAPAQSGIQPIATGRGLQHPGAPNKVVLPPLPANPIPINALPFQAFTSGYYQLTQNLTGVPGSDAIEVLAADVVIDLNGYAINAGATGIQCTIRTTIFNGEVFGFQEDGIRGTGCTVVGVRVHSNGRHGMDLGSGSVVQDCTVRNNTGDGIRGEDLTVVGCRVTSNSQVGIRGEGSGLFVSGCTVSSNFFGIATSLPDPAQVAGNPCVIEDSKITENSAAGLQLKDFAQVRRCVVSATQQHGITVGDSSYVGECIVFGNNGGIFAGEGSKIERCVVRANDTGIAASRGSSIIDCEASQNQSIGIVAGGPVSVRGCNVTDNGAGILFQERGGRVEGCTVFGNHGYGISVRTKVLVLNNAIGENSAQGILASEDANRIEGNHVASNAKGIEVLGARNLIARNTLDANGTQMQIAAGNFQGPFSKTSGFVDNANPWANFDLSFPFGFP